MILTRYIAKTVLVTTGIVMIALLGMTFFISLINQFNHIGKGDYDLLHALGYVALTLPQQFYTLFPMAGLIGCLFGLGILAGHSELVVMRAAGFSTGAIIRAVMAAIFMCVLFVTLIAESVGPRLLHYADSMRAELKSKGQAVATRQGIWIRDKNSFIHIDQVLHGNQLIGITRYDFDDKHRLTKATYAESASYQQRKWHLTHLKESLISEEKVTTQDSADAIWNITLNPAVLKVAQIEPEEMSLPKLYNIMRYKKANRLEYIDYALPFWQRIFQPLATCVMMFLAIPFIFGSLRTVAVGMRLVLGIVVGFTFYSLNQFLVPFSTVFQLPPMLAAIIPTLLFGLLGYLLMLKVR